MAGRTVTEKFEYSEGDRLTGKRGQYRVKSPLGAGGMGACYLVEDTDAPRQYVAKVIHSSLLENKAAIEAFNLEGRGLIALHACPQIVQAFHLDATDKGVPFYLMEVLTGRTLRAALTGDAGKRMRLDPDTACGIGIGVANALIFAHGKEVVHCDLKPENVMLVQTPHGAAGTGVKLLDFGVMKGMLIRSGYQGAGGTPAYMAPEQLRREDVDPRADIFAFGLLFYEMIAGRHPFQNFGMGIKGAVARIDQRPIPLAASNLGIPDEVARLLDDVIERLVEPDKAKREGDASYILVKLTEAKRLIANRIKKRNVHAATTNPGAPSPELIAHVTGAVDEATVAPGTDPDLDVHRVHDDAVATSSTLPSPKVEAAKRKPSPEGLASTLPPSSSLPEPGSKGVSYVENVADSHKSVAEAAALLEAEERKRAPKQERTERGDTRRVEGNAKLARPRAADTEVEPPEYHQRLRTVTPKKKDARDRAASYGAFDEWRRSARRAWFKRFGDRRFVDVFFIPIVVVAMLGMIAAAYYALFGTRTNSTAPTPAVSQTSQAR